MIHPPRVILVVGMKTLFQVLLLVLLAGCASPSPYYPVAVSSEGDYYIAERATSGPYYGTGSMMFTGIGLYPWWLSGYPPPIFAYYSPYFYPYYFSVWHHPGYYPFHGFYGGYYAYPRPAHRNHWHHGYRGERGVARSPVLPPTLRVGPAFANPEPRRSLDRVTANRDLMNGAGTRQKTTVSARSTSVNTRSGAQSLAITPRTGPANSSGFSRASIRAVSPSHRTKASNLTPAQKHR
jgi:hypothetical protein